VKTKINYFSWLIGKLYSHRQTDRHIFIATKFSSGHVQKKKKNPDRNNDYRSIIITVLSVYPLHRKIPPPPVEKRLSKCGNFI
jgi:hypothetical protein